MSGSARKVTVLYEVYQQRLLLDGIDGLIVLDRDRNFKRACKGARAWGGLVIRAECLILRERHPMVREILSWKVVYTAPPKRKPYSKNHPTGNLTVRQLRGKMQIHGRFQSRFDRRKPKPPPPM